LPIAEEIGKRRRNQREKNIAFQPRQTLPERDGDEIEKKNSLTAA
jgi:hypothetical protein